MRCADSISLIFPETMHPKPTLKMNHMVKYDKKRRSMSDTKNYYKRIQL